jgi:hypothetical protein
MKVEFKAVSWGFFSLNPLWMLKVQDEKAIDSIREIRVSIQFPMCQHCILFVVVCDNSKSNTLKLTDLENGAKYFPYSRILDVLGNAYSKKNEITYVEFLTNSTMLLTFPNGLFVSGQQIIVYLDSNPLNNI